MFSFLLKCKYIKATHAISAWVAFLLLCFHFPANALEIRINLTGNPLIDLPLTQAAARWERIVRDPVVVNVQVQLGELESRAPAHTKAEYLDISFLQFKQVLLKDAKSSADKTFVAGLPKAAQYSKLMNGTWESANVHKGNNYVQHDLDAVELTRANAKALGLVGAKDAHVDAVIVFNSVLFNSVAVNSNKVTMDVSFIAFHELGHVLGFVSGVNILDYFYFFKGTEFSHSAYAKFATPLDFTRCSMESVVAGADMDWTVSNRPKHFSIDGKCSLPTRIENAWSRGVYLGDGFEPGHWRNNSGLGVMVPASTKPLQLSELERLAFDVIGWDLQNQSDKILQKKP